MVSDPAAPPRLDLPAYLERIAYAGELTPTVAVLRDLHLAHATHIPFENLDILLGRPVRLDLASLQAKLVAGGRGGYCFEQNLLFQAALEAIGFGVRRLGARVILGGSRTSARAHATTLVRAEGSDWLADVGFGAGGPLLPLPLRPGEKSRQFAWSYRLVEESGTWILQSIEGGAWTDLYLFTLEPQELIDYEVANWYTSTHPRSHFVGTLTAQRTSPAARWTLRRRELKEEREGKVRSRMITDGELLEVLDATFGIHLPEGTRFEGEVGGRGGDGGVPR